MSPVLSLSCCSSLLRLSLHTWDQLAPCTPGEFATVSAGALTPFDSSGKYIPYDFRNPASAGGFGAVQKVTLTCQIQHRGSAPDFPYGRRDPPSSQCWTCSAGWCCPLCVTSPRAVRGLWKLIALLGHNSSFLLSLCMDFLSLLSHVQAVTQSSSWVVWLLLQKLFRFHCSLRNPSKTFSV